MIRLEDTEVQTLLKDLDPNDCLQLGLDLCQQASALHNVKNILGNYQYREIGAMNILRQIYPEMIPAKGRHGSDGYVGDKSVELKSSTYVPRKTIPHMDRKTLKRFEFDKITNQARCDVVLSYDMYAFSIFEDFKVEPKITFFVHSDIGVCKLRTMMKSSLKVTLETNRKKLEEGKQVSRDSLVVYGIDILTHLSDDGDMDCFIENELVSVSEFTRRLDNHEIK